MTAQTLKTKVHVTQSENDKYFQQKLPTWRNGFCEVTRKVIIAQDPHSVYADGEYGFITVYGRKIIVVRSSSDTPFEISGATT